MEAKDSDIIGKRVCLKDAYGTIRFFGKLHNNEKAGDDNWYGIEWDDSSKGRNNGSVNGFQYFVPLFHDPTDNCCSFIREGKIPFGISLKQALEEKYQANKELSEEERKLLEEEESKVLVVNTIKEGQKLIEVVGIEKSYKWRYDIYEGTEFLCQNMKIDSIGQNGEIKKLIPKCKHLYLDKNLLSSWDDFFMITSQCILIETLNLTDNIFLPIDSSYFELKSSIPKLVTFTKYINFKYNITLAFFCLNNIFIN